MANLHFYGTKLLPVHNSRQLEEGLMYHQTHYTSYWRRVFTGQVTQPTVSKHRTTIVSYLSFSGERPTMLQWQICRMKQINPKYANININ